MAITTNNFFWRKNSALGSPLCRKSDLETGHLTKAAFSICIKLAIDRAMEGKWLIPPAEPLCSNGRGKPAPPEEYSDYC